ncbi:MAG TPA: L,D-transpeptidase family protein [Steroidobacteraceae bacterium]|nr:L,D-transpeptidase family protein [Steroidobacteraceae bacterium]
MALVRSGARIAGALVLVTLAACSLLGGPWTAKRKPPPPPAPPPPPVAAAPVATEKFEIDATDDDVIGVVQVTKVGKDDTLTDIARRFNAGYEEISRANPGVDVWVPGAGREVVVPTQYVLPDAPHEGIVVNIAEMRLYYFPPHKKGERQVVYTHPIGIGRVGWQTPGGVTKVVRKAKDPVWRPPADIIKEHRADGDNLPAVVGPGPDNPLGNRALYLGWPEYLIHGTNKPVGVGMRVSHGCMHLFPEDIMQIYDLVAIGTKVRVVNQPFVFGWHGGRLYMQAFGSLEDDRRDWQKAEQALLAKALGARMQARLKELHEQVDWDLVMQLAAKPRGVPVPVTGASASIEQVIAGAPRVEDRVPEGSTWDGKTDLPMDEKTYQEIVSETQGAQHKAGT